MMQTRARGFMICFWMELFFEAELGLAFALRPDAFGPHMYTCTHSSLMRMQMINCERTLPRCVLNILMSPIVERSG